MADVLILRCAEALRKASFHNDDRKRFRRLTLSDMAEPGAPLAAARAAGRSEDAMTTATTATTDSEASLTPEGSSSSGGLGGGHGNGDGTLEQAQEQEQELEQELDQQQQPLLAETPTLGPTTGSHPGSPGFGAALSRHASFSGSSSYQEDWDIPPLDRLTVLDLLDNFALPQQLEKLSKGISAQTRKLKKSRDALKSRSQVARERMVEEWRHRVPSAEEQLERYRARMRTSVEKLGRQWNDTKVITLREKVAFICGVLNIFISGYLIGGWPQYMHLWYTGQILYFMPIRFYTYHKRGYHYFLADLCYFVNLLLLLSLWAFPGSRRLFVSCYCLAFGNNAVAIVMWRNSLVFHSFDKVTSLFIHVMPCATLHCIVHLLDPAYQQQRFPAVYALQHPAAPGAASASASASSPYVHVGSMLLWSSIPYAVWQLSYYFFITVRRRDKIAAGRPTSFTWLRRSYSKTWIGKIVLALPRVLQEPAFMLIQYAYAVTTMLPCPVWFAYRWASGAFLMGVFTWSIYNGSTYYIDVFGKRFQKELEAMKREVAKWQEAEHHMAGGAGGTSIGGTSIGGASTAGDSVEAEALDHEDAHEEDHHHHQEAGHGPHKTLDALSAAAEAPATALNTGADWDGKDGTRRRH